MSKEENVINDKEYKFESKMYILHELKDELTKAMNNIDEVVSQQHELRDLIVSEIKNLNDEDGKWQRFIDGLDKSNDEYDVQKKKLTNKRNHLEAVLKLYETKTTDKDKEISELIDTIVSYTLIAIS